MNSSKSLSRICTPVFMAWAIVCCGAATVNAAGNHIPGVYDPVAKRFQLYLPPQANGAAATTYSGTLNITISIVTNGIPAGTALNYFVYAYTESISFQAFVSGSVAGSGKADKVTVALPYKTLVSDPKDKVNLSLSVNATYTNDDGITFNPSGNGSRQIRLPKNGAQTAVTLATAL